MLVNGHTLAAIMRAVAPPRPLCLGHRLGCRLLLRLVPLSQQQSAVTARHALQVMPTIVAQLRVLDEGPRQPELRSHLEPRLAPLAAGSGVGLVVQQHVGKREHDGVGRRPLVLEEDRDEGGEAGVICVASHREQPLIDALLAKNGEEKHPKDPHEGLEAAAGEERDGLCEAEEAPQPRSLHLAPVEHLGHDHGRADCDVPDSDRDPGNPDAARVHEREVEEDLPSKDERDERPDEPREDERPRCAGDVRANEIVAAVGVEGGRAVPLLRPREGEWDAQPNLEDVATVPIEDTREEGHGPYPANDLARNPRAVQGGLEGCPKLDGVLLVRLQREQGAVHLTEVCNGGIDLRVRKMVEEVKDRDARHDCGAGPLSDLKKRLRHIVWRLRRSFAAEGSAKGGHVCERVLDEQAGGPDVGLD
mmetsp:Transcript_30937/g.91917  ORF Transcript_30937/g.91917 Transcript_30937/m.91917 type:complete len:419 (+) Transcript_30937:209-1465(+)